ncbi:tRNA(Met) cytidine acetate ligase [Apilactobacillus kunkeei]|nr:tRNA(Met) cytidine acetate ligase [Apilactobacillus kunkeei]CAI2592152.1 tRNA(Met) cytidine acetate ligase [Apilactobacillus kunkeei]CAI2802044.1 tRNA(Met) cytidine acetate ligase [Apilactobacillus kunkeei]
MKAVGIIAEYNPFHNGHKYQIEQAKQATNADTVIVIMSGNWVQRGQPAIIDKWTRTQMALENGADMVIELPAQCSVQPADIFAKHAVNILANLQCEWLSFGSEHPELDFNRLANIDLRRTVIDQDYTKSYAELIRIAISNATGEDVNAPNDVLALNYAIANLNNNHKMKLVPVKRNGANHHDLGLNDSGNIASASSIRKAIMDNSDSLDKFIPSSSNIDALENHVSWEDFWPLLKYKIETSSIDDLNQIYQMNEGLEYRLKKYIYQSQSFDEFLRLVKSKRYTYSRIKRLFVYTLLNWRKTDELNQEYVRVLGFNKSGRAYLNDIKKDVNIPIITKINKELSENELNFDVVSGRIYENINHLPQDAGKIPLIY